GRLDLGLFLEGGFCCLLFGAAGTSGHGGLLERDSGDGPEATKNENGRGIGKRCRGHDPHRKRGHIINPVRGTGKGGLLRGRSSRRRASFAAESLPGDGSGKTRKTNPPSGSSAHFIPRQRISAIPASPLRLPSSVIRHPPF